MGCRCCGGGINLPKEMTLEVTGMNCKHCQKAVEDALGTLDGVTDVKVDLEGGLVKIKYDPIEVGLPEFNGVIFNLD